MMKNSLLKPGIVALLFCCHWTLAAIPSSADYEAIDSDIEAIKKFRGYLERRGEQLHLYLESNKEVVLKSDDRCNDGPDNCMLHTFRDFIKGYYLIHIGYYESGEFVMISRKTGQQVEVYDRPQLSPNGARFVTVAATEAEGENGVFIWRFGKDTLKPEFAERPSEYTLYTFINWRDNNTIALSKFMRANQNLCPNAQFVNVPVLVKRSKGIWKFYEDLRPDKIRCE
jgi:hypothetical protein